MPSPNQTLNEDQLDYVVAVLKGGTMFPNLLNDFERNLIREMSSNYAKYTTSLAVRGKTWSLLDDINKKLRLGLHAMIEEWPVEIPPKGK